MPKPLEIRVLGEIAVRRGGEIQGLPASKKTRALLGYLVVAAAPQTRQRLCDLLWDGPDDPRAALRWSLTKLRPLVDERGAMRLAGDREHVAFEPHGARVDLFEAEQLVRVGVASASVDALRAAADLLGGDLLEGLDLPDCYRFYEWCTGHRERVRALRISVLDALVAQLDSVSPEDALVFARRRVAADPLSDVAHAGVVRLLARLGRRAEAYAQVEACRRILDRELGGRKSSALELARLEIGKAPDTAVAPSAPAPAPVVAARTERAAASPMLGREREREIIDDFVRSARNGQSDAVLLVTGEPGIGKTRLLDELVTRFDPASARVLTARARETELVRPYGPWIDLLRSVSLGVVPDELRAPLAPLLPELGSSDTAPEAKARLFDGVARLLETLARETPVLVVIDDLHWLDEASCGLFHYIVRRSVGSRVALAAATRTEDLADNPAALGLVRALRREERIIGLAPAALGAEHTAELVRATATSASEAVDHARVFRESGGNPLFVIEIARSLDARDAAGPSPLRSLDALFEERLARLEPHAGEVLRWAAALGRAVDPELLVRVSGDNLAQTIAAIGELERRGVLVSANGRTYAFTHDLMRAAAYRQLSVPRRRLVHAQIARMLALAATSANDGAAWADVVHHASLGEDPELVARACLAAGEHCAPLARRQAKDFAARGLAAISSAGDAQFPLRVQLLRLAAVASHGDSPERNALDDELERAIGDAQARGDSRSESVAQYALSYRQNLREDFDGARVSSLGAAAAARTSDPRTGLHTITESAFCLALIERDFPGARALLDEAKDLARAHRLVPSLDGTARDASLAPATSYELGLGMVRHFEGDERGARVALERGVELARATSNWWREAIGLIRLALLDLEGDDWDAALRHAAALAEVARRLGDGSEAAIAGAISAVAQLGAGRADDGASELAARVDAAFEALLRVDAKAMFATLAASAAKIELRASRDARAATLAARALEAARAVERPSAAAFALAVLATCAHRANDPERAAQHIAAARALETRTISASARAALSTVSHSNGGEHARTNDDRPKRKRR